MNKNVNRVKDVFHLYVYVKKQRIVVWFSHSWAIQSFFKVAARSRPASATTVRVQVASKVFTHFSCHLSSLKKMKKFRDPNERTKKSEKMEGENFLRNSLHQNGSKHFEQKMAGTSENCFSFSKFMFGRFTKYSFPSDCYKSFVHKPVNSLKIPCVATRKNVKHDQYNFQVCVKWCSCFDNNRRYIKKCMSCIVQQWWLHGPKKGLFWGFLYHHFFFLSKYQSGRQTFSEVPYFLGSCESMSDFFYSPAFKLQLI